MFSISDLPVINASLNAVSTVFISLGWFFIRRDIWQRHVPCMIAAIISSTLFLIGYITYHLHVGEKSSGYTGWIAAVYFPILASHVLLAFITLPLVIVTPARALDNADLALCLCHRRDCLPFSLPMVPAGKIERSGFTVQVSEILAALNLNPESLISSLALRRELMFDQVDPVLMIYGDDCDV